MKEDKAALDCCRQLLLCICARWHGDLVRDWSGHRTSPEHQPAQMCNSFLRSHCWRPGGRNYTRDDPVLLSRAAIQLGLTFVGWLWSYPPPSVATMDLIPLMSSSTDHHIATLHMF